MRPSAWGLIPVLMLVVTAVFFLLLRRATRFMSSLPLRHLEALRTVHGMRYEVLFEDWGPDHQPPDMRYRWTVLDVDRAERRAAYPTADLDPEGAWGVGRPYMLGNSATFDLALREATAWVVGRGGDWLAVSLPVAGS